MLRTENDPLPKMLAEGAALRIEVWLSLRERVNIGCLLAPIALVVLPGCEVLSVRSRYKSCSITEVKCYECD
jgi:hypothetical protein